MVSHARRHLRDFVGHLVDWAAGVPLLVVCSARPELYELQDRGRFEVSAFSCGPPSADPIRERISAAVDHFVDLNGKSDMEAAAIARELGIDIAIDLGGHTKGARTGIFAARGRLT